MSRGTSLATLRTLLKAEISEAQETNTAADTEFNYALANKQKDLANGFDWPFLRDKWDKAVVAGDRYVDLPTSNIRGIASTINFERPVQVFRYYNAKYEELEYGIGTCELNNWNSDLDERNDPVRRWELDTNSGDTSNADEFEIWPIPAAGQTIRFVGQRAVRALAADADVADLDDMLLVYFVAADYLARREQTNAPLMLGKAQAHLIKLRAGYPTDTDPIVFGKNTRLPRRLVRTVPIIATA